MKLKIEAVSAAKPAAMYKKGDRLIINAGTKRKPEYFCVTVTSVRSGKWNIQFDDGDKGAVDDVKDIVGRAKAKKRKASFTQVDLDKYLLVEKAKPVKNPANKTPVRHVVKPKKVRVEKEPKSGPKGLLDKFLEKTHENFVVPQNMPKGLNSSNYKDTFLGRHIGNNFVLGIFKIGPSICIMSRKIRQKGTGTVYSRKTKGYDAAGIIESLLKSEQVSFQEFQKGRELASKLKEIKADGEKMDKEAAKSLHLPSYYDPNKPLMAKIEFTDVTQWLMIKDIRPTEVAIWGSGSKLRWIPTRSVKEVRSPTKQEIQSDIGRTERAGRRKNALRSRKNSFFGGFFKKYKDMDIR